MFWKDNMFYLLAFRARVRPNIQIVDIIVKTRANEDNINITEMEQKSYWNLVSSCLAV